MVLSMDAIKTTLFVLLILFLSMTLFCIRCQVKLFNKITFVECAGFKSKHDYIRLSLKEGDPLRREYLRNKTFISFSFIALLIISMLILAL